MGWTDQIRANAAAIQMILDKGVNIAQLPEISTTVQPGDMLAMRILSTGETVRATYNDIISAFSASAVQFYPTLGSFPPTGFTNKLYISLADNLMYIWDNGAYEIAGGAGGGEHNHDDLYQPLDADLTAIAGLSATVGYLKKTATDTWMLDESTFLTSETDPIFTAWDKSTGISIDSDQVTDFHTAVTNNSAVLLNTAKISATGNELEASDIDTLAELNAILTDAELIDTNDPRLSDARTPLSHTHIISEVTGLQTALDGKVDDAQVLTNVPLGALFTDTLYDDTAILTLIGTKLTASDINTLAELNAILTDADLINTTDPRLSDARTPLAHTHPISEVVGLQTSLDGKVDDAQVLTNVPAGAVFTDTIYTLPFADNSANWNTAYSWGNHAGLYEPLLGNPSTNGYVLSSTTLGVRSWIPAGAGSQNLRQVLDVGSTASSPDTNSQLMLDITNTPYIGWMLYNGATNYYSTADFRYDQITLEIYSNTSNGSKLNLVPLANYISVFATGGLSTKFSFEQPTSSGIQIKYKHPVGATASTIYYAPLSINGVFADSNANITIPVGTGDMLKSVYDTNNNGIVDDSAKVNGLTVLTAVPAGALFTDTVYNDTALQLLVASKLSSADIDTLAKLNAIITTPDLIDTTDPRLSDARTPTAHTHIISEVTGLQTALDGKVDDAQVLTNVPAGALFTDTWLPNTQAQNGYVTAGGSNFNKAWATDGTGVPAWRDISTTAIPGATAKHTQAVANTTWNFSHGLGEPYPVITVWNDLGKVIVPQDITRVNNDNLTITFHVAVAGVATAVVGGTGNGISSIVRTIGDGSPGTTDTYTITYTNASTSTFTVYNGADGVGGGSPLTTKGDLYTFTTVGARLPVGTNGYILSANSATATGLEWIIAPTSGGVTNLSYTASPTNGIVVSDTGTDATIPLGTGTNAGLLAPAQFTILSNTSGTNSGDNAVNSLYSGLASSKQDSLISGTNIKTVNGESILGSGNISIAGGIGIGGTYNVNQSPDNGSYALLSGTIDGVNAIFTVSFGSYVSGTLVVYLNGQLLTQGVANDYTETTPASGTFTFVTPPPTGSVITAMYNTVSAGLPTTNLTIDDHVTPSTTQVVGIVYGTSATPPTANTTPIGTLYIQYTA